MKIQTSIARDPYYELSDAVITLVDVSQDLDDQTLAKLVKQLDSVQTKIHNHLNKNYLWD